MTEPLVRRRIDAAPLWPRRGEVEYRVVWQRPSMRRAKSKLFQSLGAAEGFAGFLKTTENKVRSLGPGIEEDEPMEPLTRLRIDYRATGGWRNPEWDGWSAPRVPKVGA